MMTRRESGFTIIELTLAMSFVAVLLISVAMLSIQLTHQYSRGLTLKEVTQAGTEASNDIKRTLNQAQLQGPGIQVKAIKDGGTVLCTGTYTYIANSPSNLENNTHVVRVGSPDNLSAARLAKVRDLGGMLCSDSSQIYSDDKDYDKTTDVSELLANGSRKLVVRDLSISPNGMPAASDPFYQEFQRGRGLYTVTLSIGTGVESEIESNTTCKPPTDTDSNLDYCAIDKFIFTTRAGNSSAQ